MRLFIKSPLREKYLVYFLGKLDILLRPLMHSINKSFYRTLAKYHLFSWYWSFRVALFMLVTLFLLFDRVSRIFIELLVFDICRLITNNIHD